MSESSKIKSFRVTEDVADKLKAICEEVGNQNAALESMIAAYEVQSARAVLVERQTDISDYDSHIQALQRAFLRSVELSENAENRVRREFQRQLDEKDEMIAELQERVAVADRKVGTVQSGLDECLTESARQTKELNESLQQVQQNLLQKEESLVTAQELIAVLKLQVSEYKAAADSLPKTEQALSAALRDKQQLEREIERLKERAEIEKQRALLVSEREHTVEIRKLYSEKDKLREQIESLRAELLQEKMNEENK